MTLPPRFRAAGELLNELGITEPQEIDIEAIAQYCGATVLYRPLIGCEARIIGANEKAVITVDENAPRGRQRFSAAHELAHWLRDAGQVALLCNPDSAFDDSSGPNPESRANTYAGELLMPRFIFEGWSNSRPMTFETVSVLADLFQTSLTATAIRLVQLGSYPAILVCSDREGLRWFHRGSEVPGSLWPHDPGTRTFAFDLARGGTRTDHGDVYADEWLSNLPTRHSLHEDSRRVGEQVLTLLWWRDETPLEEINERDERQAARRSDSRDDE